jgi:WD40 repeat protein
MDLVRFAFIVVAASCVAGCRGSYPLIALAPPRPVAAKPVFVPQVVPRKVGLASIASPDEKLAALPYGGSVALVDLRTKRIVAHFHNHADDIKTLRFTPDSAALITVSANRVCKQPLVAGMRGRAWQIGEPELVHVAAVSPDGRYLFAGSDFQGAMGVLRDAEEERVTLWDLETGEEVFSNAAHESDVYYAGFDPSGRLVVSGNTDGISVWTREGDLVWEKREKFVRGVALSSDRHVAIAMGEGTRVYALGASDPKYKLDVGGGAAAVPNPRLPEAVGTGLFNVGEGRELFLVRAGSGEKLFRGYPSALPRAIDAEAARYARRFAATTTLDLAEIEPPTAAAFTRAGELFITRRAGWRNRHGVLALHLGNGVIAPRLSLPDSLMQISADGRYGATYFGLVSLEGEGRVIAPLDRSTLGGYLPRPHGHLEFACGAPGCRLLWGARVFAADSGKLLHHVVEKTEAGMRALSADGRVLARAVYAGDASSHDDVVEIIDVSTGARRSGVRGADVQALALSPDGTRVVSAHGVTYDVTSRPEVVMRDTSSGAEVWSLDGEAGVTSLALSADGTRVAIGHGRSTGRFGGACCDVDVVDAKSGARLERLVGHQNDVNQVALSQDGKWLASVSDDGSARLWNLESDRSLAIFSEGDEWLVHTDDGYFDASRNGQHLVGLSLDNRAYSIEQMALHHNRPDRIMETMGFGSAEAIAHFRARYEARRGKLDVRQPSLAESLERAPTVAIVDMKVEGSSGTLVADLRAPVGSLASYQIYVNGTPVLPAGGRAASGQAQRISETFALIPNDTLVEIEAISSEGGASLREFRPIKVSPRPVARRFFYLGIGVSKYQNSALDLKYADRDVSDLATIFEGYRGKYYDDVQTKVFVNEQATVAALNGARAFLRQAGPNDMVVVFLAGHGVHSDDAAAEYHFVTHEADLGRIRETTASYRIIERLFEDLPARSKILLLDTCESGERDPSSVEAAVARADARGLRPRTSRALVFVDSKRRARPRPFLFNRERFIYQDLARGSGVVVLSSSQGSELSYENDAWENGAFTEDLKVALTSRVAATTKLFSAAITPDGLRTYLADAVAKRTGGMQHPTIDRDNKHSAAAFPVLLTDDEWKKVEQMRKRWEQQRPTPAPTPAP